MIKDSRLKFERWWRALLGGAAFVILFVPATAAQTGRMPLIMPDDFSDFHLVAWRVENGTPDPDNPLVEGDMPWDSGGVGIHGSVFNDPLDHKWKAYVVCTPPEETSQDWPKPWAALNDRKRRLCLFEGTDGVHWTPAKLSNVPFGSYKTTNILFPLNQGTTQYASMMIDPSNRQHPYQMFVLHEDSIEGKAFAGKGYYRYQSRDGYSWELLGGPIKEPMSNDVCFIYPLGLGKYVAYFKLHNDGRPTDHIPAYEGGTRRSVFRATSVDGNTWTRDNLPVLTADERDHRDTQYMELVPLKVAGGYLGMVTVYHPITQTQNLRVAASRDGIQWWFPDRRPALDNPPLGDYGGGMMWQSQNLVVEGDRLFVYYGGLEGTHRQISESGAPSKQIGFLETVIDQPGYFLPFNAALCRAYWQADRLYALVASAGGPTIGTAVTQKQDLAGKTLWVNIVTRPPKKSATPGFDQGFMQVELLDSREMPLAGYERKDCVLLIGDHHALQVKWKGGDRAPTGAMKAKFYLKRAFLYGFEFRD